MDLQEILKKYQKKILNMNNVIGIGRGYKEVSGERTNDEAIHVLVQKKLPKSELRKWDLVPAKLGGITTDVLEVGQIKVYVVSRTARERPAQPGVSIGHYQITAGTFGAVVYDAQTGHPLILSNNHVLANVSTQRVQQAKVGDLILQPGPYDGGTVDADVIGYLDRYYPLRLKDDRQGQQGNVVDCAVAFPIDVDAIDPRILGIGPVQGVRVPELGETLYKSGRTSGITNGKVRTLDATVTVDMGENREAIFTNQIIVDMLSEGGDSGSLVVDRRRNACGLLFAGSDQITVCNPIQAVLDALQVTFAPQIKG